MIEVLEPAKSYDLTTLAAAKAELGITDRSEDERLQAVIGRASAIVSRRAGRVFKRETLRETVEVARSSSMLMLTRWPVVSVSSVALDGVAAVVGDFAASTSGMFRRRDGAMLAPGEYAIEYTAGFDAVPDDVEAAALLVVRHLFFAAGRDPATRNETVEGAGATTYADNAVMAQVDALVGEYRAPNFG